ncbi:MAG: hypothetical protein V1837_07285 [Candidatus Woesearchaeota archaeon]
MTLKRGDSHTVFYGALVVVVGLIVIFGFRSIAQMSRSAQDAKVLQFITSLDEDAQTMSSKVGSLTQSTYSLPGAVNEVCFVDLHASPESIGSALIGKYPFIERSVDSGSGKNVFLLGDKFLESYSIPNLNLDDNIMFACVNPEAKVLSLDLKGSAKGAVLVKDWRVERALASLATTDIVSADGSATLSVPAGSSASPMLSIEVIAHPGQDFLSEAYRFGPSGAVFSQPVTLSVSFDSAVCPPARDEYIFKLFDDNNQLIEDLQYDSVDCVNHVMTFRLDHFSWGGIAAVQTPVSAAQVAINTLNVVINNGGVVMAAVGGNAVDLPYTGDFGTVVHLVAGPSFVGWSNSPAGAPFSSANSLYQTLTSTGTIYANFRASGLTGTWASVLATGYKDNTRFTRGGIPIGGWGYYLDATPSQVPVAAGGTIYFVIDPNAYTGLDWTGRAIRVRAVDYDQTNSGSSIEKQTNARLITVDRDGNELSAQTLAGDRYQFSGTVYYTRPSKIYIIEVTQGDLRGAYFSSWWP